MSNEKPVALELADIFENLAHPTDTRRRAATELRRQHARIQELEAMLDAVGAGGVSAQRIRQESDYITQPRKMLAVRAPFGYFKAEPFGWRECAETDEGAIALYEAPQQKADALDAQRYRWLRDEWLGNEPEAINMERAKGQRGLDAAIDAAIAAAKEM
jgi:hypothetical protein